MKWVFDADKNVWDLQDNSSVVARIFIKEKPDHKNRFHTRALIASIYSGARTFSRLTRKNKEWKVYHRKFHTREEMEKYLDAKKAAVLNHIERL